MPYCAKPHWEGLGLSQAPGTRQMLTLKAPRMETGTWAGTGKGPGKPRQNAGSTRRATPPGLDLTSSTLASAGVPRHPALAQRSSRPLCQKPFTRDQQCKTLHLTSP